MERRFVKPLKLVLLTAFWLGTMSQVSAAKPPLPQYNEIGSFMAQPTSSAIKTQVNTHKNQSVNSTGVQSDMSVPSYHSPYSNVPIAPNSPARNVTPYKQDTLIPIKVQAVESKPQALRNNTVQDSSSSNDTVVNSKKDASISKKSSIQNNAKSGAEISKLSKEKKGKSIKAGFGNILNSLRENSLNVCEAFKNKKISKKINKSRVSRVESEASNQTVFEAEPIYSPAKVVEPIVQKVDSPTPLPKSHQFYSVRKSIVPTPTPSFADTMIANNVYQSSIDNVSSSSSSSSKLISVQKITNDSSATDSHSQVNNLTSFDKTNSSKFASFFKNSTGKKSDETVQSESSLSTKPNIENNTINNNSSSSNNIQLSETPVKEKDNIWDKLKQDKIDSSVQIPVSQDKLDAFDEIRDYAKVLYNANKLEEAVIEFNNIPDANKISDDWLFLANIAQDNNKIDDAVFYLKKAIQLDDNNYKAHYNLGNIYLSQNKTNSALAEYKKVNKIKKDFAYAYYNKGCCYLKTNNYFNARYEFGLAIKYNPEDPVFYYNLAYTNKMMKKEKKAQEALDMYNKLMNE